MKINRPCQDANYNVIGLVDHTGRLVERCDYTPYGQRTVYSHGWNPANVDGDDCVSAEDQTIIASHLGQYVGPGNFASGDITGDGYVSIEDIIMLQCNLGGVRSTLE